MFLMFGLAFVFPCFFAGSWFFSVSVLLVPVRQSTSDGRGDFEGSVDFSEGLNKWDYGRISESSSAFWHPALAYPSGDPP
jgi:hypothetical protein